MGFLETNAIVNIRFIDFLYDLSPLVVDSMVLFNQGKVDGKNQKYNLDAKRIEIADNVLTPIVEKIDEADGDAIVSYGIDKQTKELWNGVIGIQFQLNKQWQLRSEAGIIGDRRSFMASINYRFLGFRKKTS